MVTIGTDEEMASSAGAQNAAICVHGTGNELRKAKYSALGAEPPLAGRLSRLRWVTRRMITSVQK